MEVLEKTVSVNKTILYKMAVWFNQIVFVHFIILGKFLYISTGSIVTTEDLANISSFLLML